MDISPSLNLAQLAIDAALDAKWNEALKLNKRIIKDDPANIDALNRQARVYMEMGKGNLAKKYYTQVVKLDPYNPIASKNLKIIKSFKLGNGGGQEPYINQMPKLSPFLFLQEPGKTKVVALLKVAEPQKLSLVYCGMQVNMISKNRKITIVDSHSNYLGVMPDDTSFHLLKLIHGGNKYEIFIKSIKVNALSVMIKETYRSKRFKNQPSFLENSDLAVNTDIFTSLPSEEPADDQEENEEDSAV